MHSFQFIETPSVDQSDVSQSYEELMVPSVAHGDVSQSHEELMVCLTDCGMYIDQIAYYYLFTHFITFKYQHFLKKKRNK